MQALGHGDEVLEALLATGRVGGDRLRHGGHVFLQIEHRPVLEEAAPLRVEPAEVEVVVHVAAGLSEYAAEDFRNRQNGRAHVEPKAVLL